MTGISVLYLITCCNYWFGSQHKQKLDIQRGVQLRGNAFCFGSGTSTDKQETSLILSARQPQQKLLTGETEIVHDSQKVLLPETYGGIDSMPGHFEL